jgi:tetratricopeptide (TPR) repeat protein
MTPRTMVTFAADLKDSTRFGLEITDGTFHSWNDFLATYLERYLKRFALDDSFAKRFSGDGWILANPDLERAHALVALAMTIRENFERDARRRFGQLTQVPPLRIAVCTGDDMPTRPFGKLDYAGDSIRRANRAVGALDGPGIVVNQTVRDKVFRIVETQPYDIPRNVKWEEVEQRLFRVGSLLPGYIRDLGRHFIPTTSVPYFTYLRSTRAQREASSTFSEYTKAIDELHILSEDHLWLLDAAPNAPSRDHAVKFLIRRGVPPGLATYTRLISRAGSHTDADDWLKRMRAHGVSPDRVIYNAMIDSAPDHDTALMWFNRMVSARFPATLITYTTLLRTAPNEEEARKVFEQLKAACEWPDAIAYNTLIRHAKTAARAKRLFDEMLTDNVIPNAATLSILMTCCETYVEALEFFEQFQAAFPSIRPNERAFGQLIDLAPTARLARHWFKTMVRANVEPNAVTCTTMIHRAATEREVQRWIKIMALHDIAGDRITYHQLIQRATDTNEAERWLHRMRQAKISPNVVTYTILIDKAPNFQSALRWLKQMQTDQISPNRMTSSALAKKTTSTDEVDLLAASLREARGTPIGENSYRGIYRRFATQRFTGAAFLAWHGKQTPHWANALPAAISAYLKNGQPLDALRVAMAIPHTKEAIALFQRHGDEAIKLYSEIYALRADPYNSPYALGCCCFEVGDDAKAEAMLREALALSTQAPRSDYIRSLLRRIANRR